jgi:hypothetical protein
MAVKTDIGKEAAITKREVCSGCRKTLCINLATNGRAKSKTQGPFSLREKDRMRDVKQ